MTILGYKVEFEHDPEHAWTVVRLNAEGCPTIYGTALVHPNDRAAFCKATGRRLALRRALTTFDRVARRQAWNEYWAWTNHQERISDGKGKRASTG